MYDSLLSLKFNKRYFLQRSASNFPDLVWAKLINFLIDLVIFCWEGIFAHAQLKILDIKSIFIYILSTSLKIFKISIISINLSWVYLCLLSHQPTFARLTTLPSFFLFPFLRPFLDWGLQDPSTNYTIFNIFDFFQPFLLFLLLLLSLFLFIIFHG